MSQQIRTNVNLKTVLQTLLPDQMSGHSMELRGKSRSNPVKSDEINDSRLHFDFKDQETACVSLVPSWRANFSHTSCWVRLNSYHMIISNDFLIMTTKKACTHYAKL